MDDSPLKLKCLVAKSICVRLVREWAKGEAPVINVWKRSAGYCTCSAHDWYLWQLCEMPVPRFANIQDTIQFQIEDNMAPILEQIVIWIQYHHSLDFFTHQESSFLSQYVSKLVWKHDFQLDYNASAKNILTNMNLSTVERFKFASTYCLVEEIEKFRDAIDSIPKLGFNADPFAVYWSKYLKNELHTISIPKPKNMSLDSLMIIISSERYGLWAPVEYFFEKLNRESKSVNIEPIAELYSKNVLPNLLGKFADKEWNLACRSVISKIVEKAAQFGTANQVRFCWKMFRNKMDSTNFRGILKTLICLSMKNVSNFEKWTPLLMEIWSSASSELKRSATADTKLWQDIGNECLHLVKYESSQDFRARRRVNESMKFFRMVLKSTDVRNRTEFLQQNFSWMIVWTTFAAVDRLIREFLECYNRDVVELKKFIANNSTKVERSFLVLMSFNEFDEFDVVVSFYFASTRGISKGDDDEMRNSLMNYKWKLISSSKGLMFLSACLYNADWKPLYEYVRKMVSWSGYSLETFMLSLFERGYLPGFHFLSTKLLKGEMKDLKECLSKLSCRTEGDVIRLRQLMKRLKAHTFKALFDNKLIEKRIFNRADVQDFLLWICNGDEKLVDENFRQPHLFPKGFLVQFVGCVNDDDSFQATKSMEEYLQWCFATAAERRRFKREMIYKFRQYDIIEFLLSRRRPRRKALHWFFDGDATLIAKFTADCAGIEMRSSVADILKSGAEKKR